MIESVVGCTEVLDKSRTTVERSIVLAGHEVHVLDSQVGHDVLEFNHPAPALNCIIGRVGKVAGKYDEVRLHVQGIDGGHRFTQSHGRIRVVRAFVSPMYVRQLNEIEVAIGHIGAARQAGNEYGTSADGSKVQKVSTVHGLTSSRSG